MPQVSSIPFSVFDGIENVRQDRRLQALDPMAGVKRPKIRKKYINTWWVIQSGDRSILTELRQNVSVKNYRFVIGKAIGLYEKKILVTDSCRQQALMVSSLGPTRSGIPLLMNQKTELTHCPRRETQMVSVYPAQTWNRHRKEGGLSPHL